MTSTAFSFLRHRLFAAPAALLLLALPARAGEVTFTPDNKLIVQLEPEESMTLLEIDPQTGACRKLFAPLKERITALTLDRHDRWLLATEKALWGWKTGDAAPAKIADVPATDKAWKVRVDDIAADPKTDRILVTTTETKGDNDVQTPAWIYDTAAKKWGKVRCRYVPGIETPSFNTRGELCFSVHGDVWHGIIEEDVPWSLVAYRYAAVASLYTYNGSPMQSGTCQLTTAAGQLFINHARMGGSGWGTVTALPAPALSLAGEWSAPDLKEQLTAAGKIAAGLKEIGDGERRVLMGNSRDATRAWIMWPGEKRALLIDGAKEEKVDLKLP